MKIAISCLTVLLVMMLYGPALAQSGETSLTITDIDVSAFPEVSLVIQALDSENRPITDLSNLILTEDGISISQFATETVDIGTDLIIIVDADTAFEQRDAAEGLTRREKVRDNIIRYANFFMDPRQLDRVTLIVPVGQDGRFLDMPGLSFPNEVINAVNFYDPGELSEPSLERLMQMAIQQAADSRGEGRSQAVLLYTDAGQLDEQLDLERRAAEALGTGVTLNVAILGSRADPDEIASATIFTNSTGGAYAHMPDAESSDQLFELISGRAEQSRITYRSTTNESGNHLIGVELNEVKDEAQFELEVLPPVVEIAVDNSRPIRRVATEAETPIEAIEPTHQPLAAQVTWPDGYPRRLESAALLVDGQEMPVENTILGDDGLLTFDWDIRFLEAGIYDIAVAATDELKLAAESEPIPLEIIIEQPVVAPTVAPTPTPQLIPTAEPDNRPTDLPANGLLIGVGSIIIFVVLISLVVLSIGRKRRSKAQDSETKQPAVGTTPSFPSPQLDPDMTYIQPPTFVADVVEAYLEVLENAPEHSANIPIIGSNVAIGRDANRCQIVLQDRSVSRLHARIIESQGIYRIYDEGSSSGTYVNFKRLGLSPQTLQDQDLVHLGRVHLRFRLVASPMVDA